jgi:GST-like protein
MEKTYDRCRTYADFSQLEDYGCQLYPSRYLLGDNLTVLDFYVAVVSRFDPWRRRFYQTAPKMAEVVRRVDRDPRLAAFWARRFTLDPGWEN